MVAKGDRYTMGRIRHLGEKAGRNGRGGRGTSGGNRKGYRYLKEGKRDAHMHQEEAGTKEGK